MKFLKGQKVKVVGKPGDWEEYYLQKGKIKYIEYGIEFEDGQILFFERSELASAYKKERETDGH